MFSFISRLRSLANSSQLIFFRFLTTDLGFTVLDFLMLYSHSMVQWSDRNSLVDKSKEIFWVLNTYHPVNCIALSLSWGWDMLFQIVEFQCLIEANCVQIFYLFQGIFISPTIIQLSVWHRRCDRWSGNSSMKVYVDIGCLLEYGGL